MADITAREKVTTLVRTVRNWPVVAFDKAGARGTFTYRTRSGATMTCRSRTTDVNEMVVVLSGAEYPREDTLVPEGGTIVDLGANIGSFVVWAAQVNAGRRVRGLAVEPFAPNLAVARHNVARNGITGWTLVQAAVAGEEGTVRLDAAGPVDAVRIGGDGPEVPARRLSALCREHGIEDVDLLKVDIEGAEYDVFAADADFLRDHVRTVVVEYHVLPDGRDEQTLRALVEDAFAVRVLHQGEANGALVLTNRRLG